MSIMQNDLVFDIGLHLGEDTGYYLSRGFRVLAVDADVESIVNASKRFSREIESGQLTLLNFAICELDDQDVQLHLSTHSLWNSLLHAIADRGGRFKSARAVPARSLRRLLEAYGVPFYCKLDIEGADARALTTLAGITAVPKYVSVETECVGDDERLSDEQALTTLRRLVEAGYHCFKLVEQNSLTVLDGRPFFGAGSDSTSAEPPMGHRQRLVGVHGFDFAPSSTGPFGEDLGGKWINYGEAEKLLLFHRNAFFRQPGVSTISFWCDWHAKQ